MAAGRGKRMSPFSTEIPKSLLPICNKPLIAHQINIMKEAGIKDIILVVGHLSHQIDRYMGDGSKFGVNIKYVEQREYLGIAHAVGKIEPYISSKFLLFLGDIFFISNNLSEMVELMDRDGNNAVIAVIDEKNPEEIRKNFVVLLDSSGKVIQVIEKPRYLTTNLKGCGIYLFDTHIFDAIRRTPRTAMRNEFELTDSIQILIDFGFSVVPSRAIKADINLTSPHDLLRCNIELLKTMPSENLLGKDVQLNDAKIENCVVGDNVVIKKPITVSNSLIFRNTVVDSEVDLSYSIVSPERILSCKNYF